MVVSIERVRSGKRKAALYHSLIRAGEMSRGHQSDTGNIKASRMFVYLQDGSVCDVPRLSWLRGSQGFLSIWCQLSSAFSSLQPIGLHRKDWNGWRCCRPLCQRNPKGGPVLKGKRGKWPKTAILYKRLQDVYVQYNIEAVGMGRSSLRMQIVSRFLIGFVTSATLLYEMIKSIRLDLADSSVQYSLVTI